MTKFILPLLLILCVPLMADEKKNKPEFDDLDKRNKWLYVTKSFKGETPEFILGQFKKKVNFREKTRQGFLSGFSEEALMGQKTWQNINVI